MVLNRIKQAIVNQIVILYPGITIYDEDIPQDFDTPSFLITVIEQDYTKGIGNRYYSEVSFDLAYFSDQPTTDIKGDCLSVQQNILRSFDIVDRFRFFNKSATITDNVLHFMFKVRYSEMKNEEEIKMKSMISEVDVKE